MAKNLHAYYVDLHRRHGRHPFAVQHLSLAEQHKRFDILCEQVDVRHSVIDLGCGLGDTLSYLRANGFEGRYLGLDFVEDFIFGNKEYFKDDPNSDFCVFDVAKDQLPQHYDHAIISGMFNNTMPDNQGFMEMTLKKAFEAIDVAISCNMMSTYVEFQVDDLCYFDPKVIFDFCKRNLSPFVTLRHDYGLGEHQFPYEFSLFVRK